MRTRHACWCLDCPKAVGVAACLMLMAAAVPKVLAYPGVLLHQKDGAATGDQLGISVAGAGDVNGDRYDDFIIGVYGADPGGQSYAGSAYVYSGLEGKLLYQIDGTSADDHLGYSVAGAGDVNGDGYADYIVGASAADPGGRIDAGSVYVYSGRDGELLYQKDGAVPADAFGNSVAGAGDVNRDGLADFIIGAFQASPQGRPAAGSAYVYSGRDGRKLYQIDGVAAEDYLGWSVAGAGDVNGDRHGDFIVGAVFADPGGRTDVGSAYVYSGFDGTLLYQKDGSNYFLGNSVGGAGDVNRDGYADFIIGEEGSAPNGQFLAGSAYVYSGRDGSLLYQKDGAVAFSRLGHSVAGAGDVNGDGYVDFIIGADGMDFSGRTDAGSAFVYSGLNGGLLYQIDGSAANEYLGGCVAGAGDVNRDGRADVIIGASGADPGGQFQAGSAYVITPGYLERITRLVDVPNDQGRQVVLEWSSQPANDNFVTQFAIYRRADGTAAASKPPDPFDFLKTPPGTWHFVQIVPATGDSLYGTIVPTLFDSTISGGMVYSTFFVRGLSDNPIDHFDSPIASGYSVDNLSPVPPQALTAVFAGVNVDLDWHSISDADLAHYWIYRDTLPVFGLSIPKRVGSTSDTAFLDTSVPAATAIYYKVTAVDFSGNEGGPSNEVVASACNCNCHADPICDGVTDIFDVTELVNVAFRNGAPVLDPNVLCTRQTTDVDCSGATDILDVTRMVNVAFRNGDPATEFCHPCG